MPRCLLFRRARDRLKHLGTDQRGSVSAELALATPTLLLLVLLVAQFAIWAHATHIAQAAASQALSAARVQGASSADGNNEADAVLSQLGDGPLRNPHATVDRGPQQSRVDITGDATSVVPFIHLPVRAQAVGPTERFVVPGASG